jgi:hypothetical protein
MQCNGKWSVANARNGSCTPSNSAYSLLTDAGADYTTYIDAATGYNTIQLAAFAGHFEASAAAAAAKCVPAYN